MEIVVNAPNGEVFIADNVWSLVAFVILAVVVVFLVTPCVCVFSVLNTLVVGNLSDFLRVVDLFGAFIIDFPDPGGSSKVVKDVVLAFGSIVSTEGFGVMVVIDSVVVFTIFLLDAIEVILLVNVEVDLEIFFIVVNGVVIFEIILVFDVDALVEVLVAVSNVNVDFVGIAFVCNVDMSSVINVNIQI